MMKTAELAADLLMLSGVVRDCPDCAAERIFVATDDGPDPGVAYCCATCGAAILVDLFLDSASAAIKVA